MTERYSTNKAKATLEIYFSTLYKKCGLEWNSDNIEDIDSLVDNLIEAVKEEAEHQAYMRKLED